VITRPLDLASKLRPPPRNLDAFFFLNAGVLVLFFTLFGSRFVLAPGLGLDFRLPSVTGATAGARPPTHAISVTNAGQIITSDGVHKLEQLGRWLQEQAKGTPSPVLLVRGSGGVPIALTADIVALAQQAGFEVILAAEELRRQPAGEGR
jgi:biopolymer transport protein ExbD